jgi:hypothetical protein
MSDQEEITSMITSVNYSRLVNLGDYENEKLGASALVPEGTDPEKVVSVLRDWINNIVMSRSEAHRIADEYREIKWEIKQAKQLQEKMARDYRFCLDVLHGHNVDTTGYNPPSFLSRQA